MFVSGKSKKIYCIFNAQTVKKRIKHIKHAYLNFTINDLWITYLNVECIGGIDLEKNNTETQNTNRKI